MRQGISLRVAVVIVSECARYERACQDGKSSD
jgi:hypothetical protein